MAGDYHNVCKGYYHVSDVMSLCLYLLSSCQSWHIIVSVMVISMSGMVYNCVCNGYHDVSGGDYRNVCKGYHHVSRGIPLYL